MKWGPNTAPFVCLTLLAATLLAQAFAQSSRIAQTEVRVEPTLLQAPSMIKFGVAVAISANGDTLAMSGVTTDVGPISEAGDIYIFERFPREMTQNREAGHQ